MNVGFIGLGKMGRLMAKNFINSNHTLFAYDINVEAIKNICFLGAISSSNPKDLLIKSDIIMLSLPNSKSIKDVILGSNGILEAKDDLIGKAIINFSTNSIKSSKYFDKLLKENRSYWIEAPVSGGIVGADQGNLTVMIAGDRKQYLKYKSLLEVIGKRIEYTGDTGTALAIKFINQLLFFNNLTTIVEAMNLTNALGVNLDSMFKIILDGSGESYALKKLYKKHIGKNNHNVTAVPFDLLIKDMDLILDIAKDNKLPIPFSSLSQSFFRNIYNLGHGNVDIINYISNLIK
ncbi:MAG: NAD(P)-dependent oxidoreductase [Eubacteriaceae bacterium]